MLLVLYQQPLDYTGEHREILTQQEICEQLDMLHHLYGKNRLVPGILDLLEADKYVYGFIGGHWRITEKGVSVIEG